jgi:hypothetical protein
MLSILLERRRLQQEPDPGRCEGRFGTSVLSPPGVVSCYLTA